MAGSLQGLASTLEGLTGLETGRDENAIVQILGKVFQVAKVHDNVVFDTACAPGNVMDVVARRNILWPNGQRAGEQVQMYVWVIVGAIHSQVKEKAKCIERRQNLVRFGYLTLAVKELDYFYSHPEAYSSSLSAAGYLWNMADNGDVFAKDLAASQIFDVVVKLYDKFKMASDDKSVAMLKKIQSITYNSARWEECREKFRDHPQLIQSCEQCLSHKDGAIAMKAGFTICLVSGRDESGAGQDLLQRSPQIVNEAIKILNTAVDADINAVTWDPEELTRILMNISISDANKPMLTTGIPVMIKALQKRPDNAKMVKEILICFMQLSFEPTTMKILQDSVATFETAIAKCKMDSEDQAQLNALMGRLKPESKPPSAPKRQSVTERISKALAGATAAKQPQIMISYNWGSKETVLKINAALVAAKYKVWIDVEQMAGNIADKMAEAVEGSDAVLMCISSKYKESANCRQEAEYALECKKPLVVLMMEKNYHANGWLGLMVGRKLWVDCTDPNAPDIAGIIREVSSIGFGTGAPVPTIPASASTPAPASAPSAPASFSTGSINILSNKAATMTPSDVSAWLKAANVSESIQAKLSQQRADGRALLGMFLGIHQVAGWLTEEKIGASNAVELFTFAFELEKLVVSKST